MDKHTPNQKPDDRPDLGVNDIDNSDCRRCTTYNGCKNGCKKQLGGNETDNSDYSDNSQNDPTDENDKK